MADIGALPTKNSVRITSSTGDFGTVPGATSSAAGVMTADQVKKLEELWQVHQTKSGGSLVVQSAPSVDVSQFPTRIEVQQALAQLPRQNDVAPVIAALKSQVLDLQDRLRESLRPQASTSLLIEQPAEVVDARARSVLEGVIEGMSSMEQRLQELETSFDILRHVAVQKAAQATGTGG